jgi:hypothetical protein
MVKLKIFNRFKKIHLSILNKKKLKPQIVSNEFLFLTRFHPELFRRYFSDKNIITINKLKHFASALFYYLKSFVKISKNLSTENLKKKKILFLSTIDHKKFINKENQHLNELIKVFKYQDYVEVLKHDIDIVSQRKKINNYKKKFKRIYLSNNLGFLKEIKLLISLYCSFYIIRRKKYLKNFFSFDAFFLSLKNYRFYIQFSLLLKILKPQIIFFTYESYPWERLIVKAAKIYDKKIKCIGYQKSVITKYSYLMRTNFKDNSYNPDFIICKSEVNRKKLLDKSLLKENQVIVVGKSAKKKNKTKKFNNLKVLVVPESYEMEEKKMFLFTKRCAEKYPNVSFVFRQHPVSLLNISKSNLINIKNLRISNNTFDTDLKNNNIIFFRGSYAVIKAAENGLFPVYLNFKNDLDANINPMYEIEKKFFKIREPEEFGDIIKNVKNPGLNKNKIYIINHCKQVNTILDKKLIRKQLNIKM